MLAWISSKACTNFRGGLMLSVLILNSELAPPLPIRKFTVDQYHQLGELGVLTPDDRVELLEGWIVEKMNHGPAHGFAVRFLTNCLQSQVPTGWICQCQLPITTLRSEPEPDFAVVRGCITDYRDRHPSGNDCRLLIEVADSSLQKDRAKAAIYFSAGVEEYWIVNLEENHLECYLKESPDLPQVFARNDTIRTEIGTKIIEIDLSDLF